MKLQLRTGLAITALILGAIALAGCPLSFESDDGTNVPPITFFENSPPDTSFDRLNTYRWLGTDLDSDVVAYQYQLVEVDSLYGTSGGALGGVIRSVDPDRRFRPGEDDVLWSDRQTDNFHTFDQMVDGWYEMRVRSIDDRGTFDPSPAKHNFFVFIDERAPNAVVLTETCTQCIEVNSWTFLCTASDSSSEDKPTPRTSLEYSYVLRGQSTNCGHSADAFTDWIFFPDATSILEIDGSRVGGLDGGSGTRYDNLDATSCAWDFTFRVRDPAGNIATQLCTLTHQ